MQEVYWPTGKWQYSEPEEQGLDAEILEKMFQYIHDTNINLHSLLIVKNGYMVVEKFFDPYTKEDKHNIFSITKGVISSLVGIALHEGYFETLSQKVKGFFPDVAIDRSSSLENITVKNLLTMTTGIKDGQASKPGVFIRNWIKHFFSLPVEEKKRGAFCYNNENAHMLSILLQRVTGENTLEFAKRKLFKPLEIEDVEWELGPERANAGGWGMKMLPHDVAKLGLLYLRKGSWKHTQILPGKWIEEAWTPHIKLDFYELRPSIKGYGYMWWLNAFSGYRVNGFGGQYLWVFPEHDMVMVVNGGLTYGEQAQPVKMAEKYLIPSVKPKSLSSSYSQKLKAFKHAQSVTLGKKSVFPYFPEKWSSFSGKKFLMELNKYQFKSFCFTFNNLFDCTLEICQGKGPLQTLKMQFNGTFARSTVFRLGTAVQGAGEFEVGIRGQWRSDNELFLEWKNIGEPFEEEYVFTFYDETLKVEIKEKAAIDPENENSVFVLWGRVE
ncbi:MAG: beta-lactamase family protein [Clostridia bacterium]|nr:beta-lactamase family protein [Clostridia bacterium]